MTGERCARLIGDYGAHISHIHTYRRALYTYNTCTPIYIIKTNHYDYCYDIVHKYKKLTLRFAAVCVVVVVVV